MNFVPFIYPAKNNPIRRIIRLILKNGKIIKETGNLSHKSKKRIINHKIAWKRNGS